MASLLINELRLPKLFLIQTAYKSGGMPMLRLFLKGAAIDALSVELLEEIRSGLLRRFCHSIALHHDVCFRCISADGTRFNKDFEGTDTAIG